MSDSFPPGGSSEDELGQPRLSGPAPQHDGFQGPRASFSPLTGATPAFDIGAAFSYGWRGFTANVGPLAIIALAVVLVNFVYGLLNWLVNGSWLLSILLSIGSTFVSMVISLGLVRAALAILDGRRPEIADLTSTDGIGVYLVTSLIVSAAIGLGLILCVIPGLVAALLTQFYGYAIVDRRLDALSSASNASPGGAITASVQVVTGNLGSVLVLGIVSLVINLVGALLCGFGLLVTLPVTAIAIAYAWRSFTGGFIAASSN